MRFAVAGFVRGAVDRAVDVACVVLDGSGREDVAGDDVITEFGNELDRMIGG